MTLQIDIASSNARLDALETMWGVSPIVEIRSGAPPANAAAADTGTLLASITAPSDFMAAASARSKGIANGPWSVNASASGTPGHFRIKSSGGTPCRAQGTCGTSATDMILDAATVTTGQQFQVTAFTINDPNG